MRTQRSLFLNFTIGRLLVVGLAIAGPVYADSALYESNGLVFEVNKSVLDAAANSDIQVISTGNDSAKLRVEGHDLNVVVGSLVANGRVESIGIGQVKVRYEQKVITYSIGW